MTDLQLYDRLKQYTLCTENVFNDNIRIAQRIHGIEGCIVECGVWRGGMIAGIAAALGNNRKCYLLDSFKGLPPVDPIDGPAAKQYQLDKTSPAYHDNCRTSQSECEQAMSLVGITNYKVFPGWFSYTMHKLQHEKIALLRIDCDWFSPTLYCLQHLFDKVVPGGIIIVDDYFVWDGCARALHRFLAKCWATERIQQLGDVCYLTKRGPLCLG